MKWRFIYRGQILSTEDFVPSVHQSEVGERFWDSADYCNNFIFQLKK
jgi:hypothetical protein